jgi:very-short-patch-repair endonuclease
MPRIIVFSNPDDIIKQYLSGDSFLQLAKANGCSRQTIEKLVTSAGVKKRTQSEQEKLKWARGIATPEKQGLGKNGVVSKAWRKKSADMRNAARDRVVELYQQGMGGSLIAQEIGSNKSFVRNVIIESILDFRSSRKDFENQLSQQREKRLSLVADDERLFWKELSSRGIRYVSQKAVGPYNVDIALAKLPIAIEIQVCRMKEGRSMQRKRIEYILNQGYAVLVIYRSRPCSFNVSACTDQVVSLLDIASQDPSVFGKYGMIGRNSNPISPRGCNFMDLPRIPGF